MATTAFNNNTFALMKITIRKMCKIVLNIDQNNKPNI